MGVIIMALFDVVRFDGLRAREWIIYRYPSDGIVWGSQIIVQEGQMALFIKGGRVFDYLEPGTYTMDSMNLPLLARFVNLPFGGKSPFSAEIYFLNVTTKLDVFWGTSGPISIIDPKYFVKLRVRAFGQMGLKVIDGPLFFTELIGGMDKNDAVKYDKVKDFYRGLVVLKTKSVIAETIVNEKISALEISTKLEEISMKSQAKLDAEFEKYGLKVVNFYVDSINFPDEDFEKINQILESKAEFEIMGDERYVTKRSFDVYETAAGNENGVAGAFVAGGIGLGAGMNMAANVNNPAMNPQYQQPNPAMYPQYAQPAPGMYQQPYQQPYAQPGPGMYQQQYGQPAMAACPQCGAPLAPNSKFCNECGCRLAPAKIRCPQCGSEQEAGSKFCSDCGLSLGGMS